MDIPRSCKVAAVQSEPVNLDLMATLTKMESLIAAAASNGANLIVFPETFLSSYPAWVPDIYNDQGVEHARYIGRPWMEYWNDFIDSAVTVPSDVTARIGRAAAAANAYVVIGINERSTSTDEQVQLFNGSVVIGPDGSIIGKRRKLTPVVHEQIYHGRGDERDVKLFQTEFGKIGVAHCFENFSPLYKHALASMGEQIHCALWYSLQSTGPLVEAAARLHAIESGAWVVVAAQYNAGIQEKDSADPGPNWCSQGGSVIVSPAGEFVAGPIYGEETILYAEINTTVRRAIKAAWDPTGRDARPDVFDFSIRRGAKGSTSDSPTEDPIPLQPADSSESR